MKPGLSNHRITSTSILHTPHLKQNKTKQKAKKIVLEFSRETEPIRWSIWWERESFKGLAHADVGLTSLQSAVQGGRNLHCGFESKGGPEKNSFRFKSQVANPPGET